MVVLGCCSVAACSGESLLRIAKNEIGEKFILTILYCGQSPQER